MVKSLAGQGADLTWLARRRDKLEEAAEKIRAVGARCVITPCDVTDTQSVKSAVETVKKEYNKADIFVLGGGMGAVRNHRKRHLPRLFRHSNDESGD